MYILIRRFVVLCISAILLIAAFRQLASQDAFSPPTGTSSTRIVGPVDWKKIPLQHPVTSTIPLPSGTPSPLPRIQHEFGVETEHSKQKREERASAVKDAFLHAWNGYKEFAWLQDEVTPVSGSFKNGLGGRGATLIDALDTLIIMGFEDEFKAALTAVKKIDFSTSMEKRLNVFETTIRYLGGLLSAYDLSSGKHHVLLDKAVQLGDMLYAAFDTPNRLPIPRWNWEQYVHCSNVASVTNMV
jgi:mannosyl-oligosaccharide alpha-1,2-mannosidase